MGEIKDKLVLIIVTSVLTALLSASGTAIYFYFDTKYTIQAFSKQWEAQNKKDEVQDIEIRLNTSEINGIKVNAATYSAEMSNNNKLLEEVRSDVKKLLKRD